eukprot:Nitzschia sp. Nitz4//scaffold24_size164493//101392//103953//NITZ4_002335-RA/size164493-processed-gene-0.236-mRNA-1//-1//CDS//3329544135//4923//frame0
MMSRKQRTNKHFKGADLEEIHTRPTESESIEDEESNFDIHSEASSDSGGFGLQFPPGYLSPNSKPNHSFSSRPTDEERLIMLAKYPNATDDQVNQTLQRQQEIKAARQQQQPQRRVQLQEPPVQQTRVASVFPVDADTGEAWDKENGQNTSRTSQSSSGTRPTNTSFDQVWGADEESPPPNQMDPKPTLWSGLWRRLFPSAPVQDASSSVCEASLVSRQDASLAVSMTSDKTPKISNVDIKARNKRIRHEMGNYTCREKCERQCHRLLQTRQGVCILLLLLVVVLAAVVTAVAAFMSAHTTNRGSASSASSDDDWLNGSQSYYPSEAPNQTESPTNSSWTPLPYPPVGTPVNDTTPTSSPSEPASPTTPTESTLPPTVAPTRQSTFSPTRAPTNAPTKTPSTSPPTVPGATPAPTVKPTRAPTHRPTSRPTSSPTRNPTQSPTKNPTTTPTMAPTISFASTVMEQLGGTLSGTESGQQFGQSVSISENGKVMAVGAPLAVISGKDKAGWVQVYSWSDQVGWEPRGSRLVGRKAGDQFGTSVSLSADGSVLVASEPTYDSDNGSDSGGVRVFKYGSSGNYEAMGSEIIGSEATDNFGNSVSMAGDGQRMIVGVPYHDNGGTKRNISGIAIVYDYVNGEWEETVTFAGTEHYDWFGWEVDSTSDGQVMCIGAPRNVDYGGYVQCYEETGSGSWQALGSAIANKLSPVRYDDNFGLAVRANKDSSGVVRVAIGSPGKNQNAVDAGLVAVYEYDSGKDKWAILGGSIVSESSSQGDELGFSLDLQDNILVVGIPGQAKVERYHLTAKDKWERHPTALTGLDGSTFGYAVRLQGNYLVVGSTETPDDNTGVVNVYMSS